MKTNAKTLVTFLFIIIFLFQNKLIEGKKCWSGKLCAHWQLTFECNGQPMVPDEVEAQICYAHWFVSDILYSCYTWPQRNNTFNSTFNFISYKYVGSVWSFETAVKIIHKCPHGQNKELLTKSRRCYFWPGDANSYCQQNCTDKLYTARVDLSSWAGGAKEICWEVGKAGFRETGLYEN